MSTSPDNGGAHLKALTPIPAEAAAAPVEWAQKHIESLAPTAAKEAEWQLRFGSDTARRETMRDILAMNGITTKPKEVAQPSNAVTINLGVAVTASGAPVLPYSNAPALDTTNAPVTVPEAPTKKAP